MTAPISEAVEHAIQAVLAQRTQIERARAWIPRLIGLPTEYAASLAASTAHPEHLLRSLLEECESKRRTDTRFVERASRLSCRLAAIVGNSTLAARSLAELGNSFRIRGAFVESEDAFERAFIACRVSEDELLLARCELLWVTLLEDKREFDRGLKVLAAIEPVLSAFEDVEATARLALKRASLLERVGKWRSAQKEALVALNLARQVGREDLVFGSVHTMIWIMANGLEGNASLQTPLVGLIGESQELYERHASGVDKGKLAWLSGRLQKEPMAALADFERASAAFASEERLHLQALVEVDRVEVLVQAGYLALAVETLTELTPLFASLPLSAELFRAIRSGRAIQLLAFLRTEIRDAAGGAAPRALFR